MPLIRKRTIRNATIDLLIVAMATLLATVLLIDMEFTEKFFEFTRAHEDWELDELFVLLVPVSVLGMWFSWRRWREAMRLVALLQENKKELTDARDAAAAANLSKSRFLANMSHEIRTPMNGVLGMSDLLRQTEMTDRQRHFVNTIHGAATALITVIDGILDFSRIEAGEFQLDPAPFNLHRTVDQVVCLLAESAASKGLEFSYFVDAPATANLHGDAGRLKQVLINLLGNAVKFTDVGTVSLKVSTGESDGATTEVIFTISDTGIGISLEDQDRLFQPFQQADATTTRRHGGTGLGLAVVLQIVELMGGKITCESHLGRGTTFRFKVRFPVSDQLASQSAHLTKSLRGVRALVVDDNPTNREIMCHHLKAWDVEADEAKGGSRALQMLKLAAERGRPYQVALLDLLMPDMSGQELARTIKQTPEIAETRLMMLSSVTWHDDKRQMRDCGIDVFLTKPLKQSELSEKLATLCGVERDASVSNGNGAPETVEGPMGLSVLLAEDNPVNTAVAEQFLTELGCTVRVCGTGVEAVASYERASFDAILMDCHMPVMDGFDATRRIRQLERSRGGNRTLIVAVSASAFETDRQRCEAAGMDGFIAKPFTIETLRSVLQDCRSRPAVDSDSAVHFPPDGKDPFQSLPSA